MACEGLERSPFIPGDPPAQPGVGRSRASIVHFSGSKMGSPQQLLGTPASGAAQLSPRLGSPQPHGLPPRH